MSQINNTAAAGGNPTAYRSQLRDQTSDLLQQAEVALQALVESYTEELDGKFSACHPRNGHNSTLQQLIRLRKAIKGSRV